MSLSVAGSLTVIERSGKHGVFSVGELATEVGTFKIKNRVLEEFTEGSYSGVFLITRIFNQSNASQSGQVWVSLCADLDWAALKIMAQSDEAEVSEMLNISSMMDQVDDSEQPNTTEAIPEQKLVDDLIGDLETLQQQIDAGCHSMKLDATLEDRDLFRLLRDTLKKQGYRFDPASQSWYIS